MGDIITTISIPHSTGSIDQTAHSNVNIKQMECILFTPKYFWKHLAVTESHKWDKHRKSVDVQERAASETKTEGSRRISSWGGRMSGGCGGCHLSACWGQEWSLTDGFRDSNALSCPQGCQTHQIINAITTIFIIVLGCAVFTSEHQLPLLAMVSIFMT